MEYEAQFEYLESLSETDDKKAIVNDLMTAYGKDVWNYAYSMTRKWDQADDITQEVFIKAFRNLNSFRNKSSVKTWLLTITRNAVIDYRRAAYFRKITLVDVFERNGKQHSAEDEVMASMTVNEIWDLVLRLPLKYREVLILFAHYQLSMKEIAHMLNIREGTVKSRLYHARTKIAKMKEQAEHGAD